jgi:hypothetical protein
MNNNDTLMIRARRINPVPPSAVEKIGESREAEDLLTAILQTSAPVATVRRSPRRALTGLIAAAVLASAGAVAAQVAMDRPDERQSAQVERDFRAQAGAHLDGWRPELSAERVRCLFPATQDPLVTFASDFPLDGALTLQRLAQACAEGNDWAKKLEQDGVGPFDASAATICVTEESAYPKTVVGVGGIDCSATALRELVPDEEADAAVYEETATRAMTSEDLQELNRMRAIEVAVLAVGGDNGCPTREQALQWTDARLREYSVADLQVHARNSGEGCYRGRIDWQAGEVWVDKMGNQT